MHELKKNSFPSIVHMGYLRDTFHNKITIYFIMKTSDLSLSVFIIFIFILLYVFNILSVGIKSIEDNWPTYRCNPVIMPFASVFGQNVMDNFHVLHPKHADQLYGIPDATSQLQS